MFFGRKYESEKKWPWPLVLALALAAILPLASFLLWSLEKTAEADNSGDGIDVSKNILVLNYHKIDNLHHSLAVTVRDFEAQMRYLKENNYTAITPDELYSCLAGDTKLPENSVLITFDDGYEDNYLNAYPILKKYGFKATIFVITGFVDVYPDYLTWEQIREMNENGIDIESHTLSHQSMTDLSDSELKAELVNSKRALEDRLGHVIEYIAYPTGAYNLHIARLVQEAGYKAAFTIKYGNVDENSNVYALERVPVFHTENTNKSFLERLHYTPIFEQFGWTKN